ncbi:MAG: hypothetical protein ACLRWC_10555 [Acutalibacter sp.]
MSDFELLSIVLMILAIIVTLMVELTKHEKVAAPDQGLRLLLKVSNNRASRLTGRSLFYFYGTTFRGTVNGGGKVPAQQPSPVKPPSALPFGKSASLFPQLLFWLTTIRSRARSWGSAPPPATL